MASPLLKFALIGRQSAGKTCMLTALGSSMEENPEGIFCSISRNKALYDSCVSQQEVKDFFTISNSSNEDNQNKEAEIIDTYDEMLQRTEGMLENFKKGILPEGTRTLSRTAFIYNFSTSNKTQFDMAIFDYAGELVSNKQNVAGNEDSEQIEKNLLSQKLITFFEKMNGLIVAVEICESDNDENIRKHSLDLKDTIEFFKAIENEGSDKARFNIPVCLIITKFDKFSEFDFGEYYKRGTPYLDEILEKYFSTKRGRCIKDLAKQIESITENNCFKVFPTISLGNYANAKSISFPLKTAGILEPFAWSANVYAELISKELDQSLRPESFSNVFQIFLKSLSNSFCKKAKILCELSPESSERSIIGKKLSNTANLFRKISIFIITMFLILCWFGGEFILDAKDMFYLKNTPVNIENIDYSIKLASDYSESNFLRHILSNIFCYSKKEALIRKNELLEEKQKLVKEYEEKQKIMLAEKERKEKEKKYKKDYEEWEKLAQTVENDLDKLDRGIQNDYTDGMFFDKLYNNVTLCKRKYHDSFNQSERLFKIINNFKKHHDYHLLKSVKVKDKNKSLNNYNNSYKNYERKRDDLVVEKEPKEIIDLIPHNIDIFITLNAKKILALPEIKNSINDAFAKEPKQKYVYENCKFKSDFDPLNDLSKIVLFTSSSNFQNNQENIGGALIEGRFNIDKIVKVIKEDNQAMKDVDIILKDGFYCIVPKNSKDGYAMFLDDRHIVIGSQSGVKAVEEVKLGKAKTIKASKNYVDILDKVNSYAAVSGCGLLPVSFKEKCKQNPNTSALAYVNSFFFDLNKDTNLIFNFNAQVDNSYNVNQVMNSLNGYIAMIKMFMSQQDPEIGEALNSLEVSNLGTNIKVNLNIPASKIEKIKAILEKKAQSMKDK